MRVRYYGHLGKRTGYGRAAEQMCAALDAADINLDIQPFLTTPGSDALFVPTGLPDHIQRSVYKGGEWDVTIIHDLPTDAVEHCGGPEGSELRHTDKPLVVYTTWEAETVPERVIEPLLRCFDQIWVPSEVNARVFRDAVKLYDLDPDLTNRIHAMPHAYDPAALVTRNDKLDSAPFRFLWYGAWNIRKNPMGLIRAYVHAFAGTQANVELVLHSQDLQPEQAGTALASCGMQGKDLPKVMFSNGDKSVADMLSQCDCYVTATHGEAWNLPAFEAAVLAGCQVITPHSIGSDDYLDASSARMVGGSLAPAQVDVTSTMFVAGKITADTRAAQGLTTESLWREPNLKQLAETMLKVYKTCDRTIQFRYDVAEKFGYQAVGKGARALLTQLVTSN